MPPQALPKPLAECHGGIDNGHQVDDPLRGYKIGSGARILSGSDSSMASGIGRKMEVGVFWSPTEFVSMARQCVHPYDREVSVPPEVAAAMYSQAVLGPEGIDAKRSEVLNYYEDLAIVLERDEFELHSTAN